MSTTQPAIAAIALDLGNVLIQADHLLFCRPLASLTGLTPEEVYAAVFASDLEYRYDTGRLTSGEFFWQIRARLGLTLTYSRFCELWNGIFAPLPEMEETVARLAGHYPLYLISNTNPLHFQYIKATHPMLRHFRRFVLSYEVGSRKPEPGIYQALIREMGQPPERCLFVDDNPGFVAAAAALGLAAWQFTTPEDFHRQLTQEGIW